MRKSKISEEIFYTFNELKKELEEENSPANNCCNFHRFISDFASKSIHIQLQSPDIEIIFDIEQIKKTRSPFRGTGIDSMTE